MGIKRYSKQFKEDDLMNRLIKRVFNELNIKIDERDSSIEDNDYSVKFDKGKESTSLKEVAKENQIVRFY